MLIEFFYTDKIEQSVAFKYWHNVPRKGDWVTVYPADATVVEGYVNEVGWMETPAEYEGTKLISGASVRITVMLEKWVRPEEIPRNLNHSQLSGIVRGIRKNEQQEKETSELPVCPNDDCEYANRSKRVEYDPDKHSLPYCDHCGTAIRWDGTPEE